MPSLWNPKAAALWSILFSPAFGAFLLARNAESLGRADEAKANKVWFYISIIFLVGVIFLSLVLPTIPDLALNAASLSLLLAWYFSAGKKQVKYVKEKLQDRYEKKHWTKPLLIAFACLVLVFVVIVILTVFAEGAARV